MIGMAARIKAAHAKMIFCNEPMLNGEEARKAMKFARVKCQLDSGHEGNHLARTKIATFSWWNKRKNPQKERQP